MGANDQRPRFYEGQFLAAADLEAAIQYPRAAQARHALGAHTWGIATGLTLRERPAPGAVNRVEVTLNPGLAWDGFGRAVLVDRPQRIAETLFADVPFAAAVDAPPLPLMPKGRLVKLWIGYDEIGAQPPAAGFQACTDDDQQARVRETFRFYAGEFAAATARRAAVTVGTVSTDAEAALTVFDPAAPRLWDTSVPHQTFPAGSRPPRWLVPLGLVRWIARDNDLGYFARLELDPSENAADRTRSLRRYIGVVAQNIEAADGAVVVHRRSENPFIAHRLDKLLASGGKWADLTKDLFWVEGDARVVGNVKLAAGALVLRNGDGFDEGTPMLLARHGDSALAPGNRELRAVIGASDQIDNRFIVGPQLPGASPPAIAPRLVVTSGAGAALKDAEGRVGINLRDPAQALHVLGDRVLLGDAAQTKAIEMRTDGAEVSLASTTSSLNLRSNGPVGHNRVLINADKAQGDGAVGIGTAAPAHGLDVKQASVRFDLSEANAGQLVLRGDPLPALSNRVLLEAANGAGAQPATELRFSGPDGAQLPLASVWADVTHVRGRLGIGTTNPLSPLHVEGDFLRVRGSGGEQAYLGGDGVANDVQLGSFNAAVGNVALWNIGAGTTMGLACANIRCTGLTTNGRIGIGTANPQAPLHVDGDILRVSGAGNEQAYLGGDGVANDVQLGSLNAGVTNVALWNIGSATRMNLFCRDIDCHSLTTVLFNWISDAALKRAIAPLDDALATVQRLRGVRFEWNERSGRAGQQDFGVIAQEVRAVLPQLVHPSAQGDAVSYLSLVPLLIEAVKELKAELDALRAEVAPKRPTTRAKRAG